MSESGTGDVAKAPVWRCGNVWATTQMFEANPVKQLIVPSSEFSIISGESDAMELSNNYGVWPAATSVRPLVDDVLWARLRPGAQPGDSPARASWSVPKALHRSKPTQVLESYRDALAFREESGESPGLRSAQLGAVHAVLGYWTTKRATPATVVMPTGTGKTETMLALLVAARLPKLLVLVPSDALREQVATKFETLGVLQELGIVSNRALRPVVGRIQHGFTEREDSAAFAEACNVMVATPQSLAASNLEARLTLLDACSHLFVDEAHHVAARTWSDIRDAFVGKGVVQFTATPFREDGRHLQGRVIYSFPLKEAQAQGYFSQINYTSVIDFDDVDRELAKQSIAKLRNDLAENYDHVLMVRVGSINRAKEVKNYYDELASDLAPVIVNYQMPKGYQRGALKALREGESRIIVCINMLGEGFDLPALKVAAIHDPQKSLAVTLQFIGRFTRTSSRGNFGVASMFVARTEIEVDRHLRELYAEDADWNLILRDLTHAAVEEQQEISDFEEGFTSVPDEVMLRSLLPKLSTVVYRAPSAHWEPQNIVEFFGEENLLTVPIGLNTQAGVAWCVIERRTGVRWGDIKTIEEIAFELYVLYFDVSHHLLYINNSANDGVFQELAEAIVGSGATRFTGSTVYRVMADIDRLVPTNVGVLDAHDQFRRFSMHVGPDVTASFSQAEAGTKSQTNISGGGYRDGEHVNISASLKGRIWSNAAAQNLKHWIDWCDSIGEKLLDNSISIDKVIGQFILPEPLIGRPDGVLLAVEWPWIVHLQQADSMRLSYEGKVYEAAYTDLVADVDATGDVFKFSVKTGGWEVAYQADVEKGRLRYRSLHQPEITVVRSRSEQPLSDWLNENGLLFVLDDDRIIERDLIYKPTWDRPPFDTSQLTPLDWRGTSFKVESQTKEKLKESIQYRAITELKAEDWDVIVDDDGTGEIADVVAIRIDSEGLLVRLVHCKYSGGETAGARVKDLYEVCGQAQKSIMWRRSDLGPFFRTLDDRARKKQKREGVSPFEVGGIKKLYEIRDKAVVLRRRMEIVIVQPGLSIAQATTQQLDLLASTQAYLRTTINAPLIVWCSP
jgi:superfamily II DNA or RNA helicase